MVFYPKISIILLSIASGASATGLRGLLSFEREMSGCVEAPRCPNPMDACKGKDGAMGWLVHNPTSCDSMCVAASELVFKLNDGFKCGQCDSIKYCPVENVCAVEADKTKYNLYRKKDNGECEKICIDFNKVEEHKAKGYNCQSCEKSCSKENLCDVGSGKVKYTLFKPKDGKCESKCVEDKDVNKHMLEGYGCTSCVVPDTRSAPKIVYEEPCRCGGEDGGEWRRNLLGVCQCPDADPVPRSDPVPDIPTPENCILKRAGKLLRYEPNFPLSVFPEDRPDVYIEVQIFATQKMYRFQPQDFSVAQIDFNPTDISDTYKEAFEAMYQAQTNLGGDGFQLRYVSKRGPGGWNTCKFSPIALDLDMDGEVQMIKGKFAIDIDGDKLIDNLNQWFGPKEGILMDIGDHDIKSFMGTTVSGQHLFGDMGLEYKDGFDKLDDHDANKDGFVSGKELDGFVLWIDANSNAKLDKGELETLADHKIVSINVNKADVVNHQSTALLSTGKTMLVHDLWFTR